MTEEHHIVAVAQDDGPEDLDADALDQITAGAEYGGTNTCEPPRRNGRLNDLYIKSWSFSGAPDAPGGFTSD